MLDYVEIMLGTLYPLTNKEYVTFCVFKNGEPDWLDFLTVEEAGQYLGGN